MGIRQMTIIQIDKRRKRKVIAESPRTGVSWTNDTTRDGGEQFTIATLHDSKGNVYRVELSEEEVMRLYGFRRF